MPSPANWAPFLAFEGIAGGVDKNGLRTIAASYYVPTLGMAERWSPADFIAEAGLPVVRRNYNQEWGNGRLLELGKDGAYKVTLTLEGIENPKDEESGVQFDADYATAEDPISTHPNYDFLGKKYGNGQKTDNGEYVFDSDWVDPQFPQDEPQRNPLFGVKSYLVPGITWSKSYCIRHPRPNLLQMLGKIEAPPKAPDGYIPTLPGNRNWLKIAAKPSFRGNCWKVQETWLMSAEDGWNRDVYR